MPAFCTRMSTRPKRCSVAATTAWLSVGLLTSIRKGIVSVVLAKRAAVAVPSASRASAMTTLAPSSANTSAMPAPMPRAAPMTMAVLLLRRSATSVLLDSAKRPHPLKDSPASRAALRRADARLEYAHEARLRYQGTDRREARGHLHRWGLQRQSRAGRLGRPPALCRTRAGARWR